MRRADGAQLTLPIAGLPIYPQSWHWTCDGCERKASTVATSAARPRAGIPSGWAFRGVGVICSACAA